MTAKPMTDEQVRQWIDACNHEPARQVLRDFIRLRGEAVQCEQAVALYQVAPKGTEHWREVSKRMFDDFSDFPGYREADWKRRKLYTHPHPVVDADAAPESVAGDAVAAHLRARVAELPERITGVFTLDAYEFAWLRAALAQDRASQAGAAVPEGWLLVGYVHNGVEPTFDAIHRPWHGSDRPINARIPAGAVPVLAAAPRPAAGPNLTGAAPDGATEAGDSVHAGGDA